MLVIKVLGTGCSKCQTTAKYIEEVAREKNIPIQLEKIEKIQEIMALGVMSTPAVIVNDQLVHAGSVPLKNKIESWLVQ